MTYRTALRTLPLFAALLAVSACACPRTPPYTGTPYEAERTAGTGSVEDDGHCLRRALPGAH